MILALPNARFYFPIARFYSEIGTIDDLDFNCFTYRAGAPLP